MGNQNINFGFGFNFTDRDLMAREKHNNASHVFLTYDFSDFVNSYLTKSYKLNRKLGSKCNESQNSIIFMPTFK